MIGKPTFEAVQAIGGLVCAGWFVLARGLETHQGAAQILTGGVTQVLAFVSTYQGYILVGFFEPQPPRLGSMTSSQPAFVELPL